MKLTRAERLALWNQYEILKRLNPEDAQEYEGYQEILANGYQLFYGEINQSVYADEVSEHTCREVQDILEMFRVIHFSAERHGYTPQSHAALFEGFDGNEGTGHYGFAIFVRRSQGRWQELSDRPDNSHSGMSLPRYRAMLSRWDELGRPYQLTPGQIEKVAG